MKAEQRNSFISYLCKYLGLGLISGSLVHAGTLGGSSSKYIMFIIAGIALSVFGNILEFKLKQISINYKFLISSVLLALGTGMVGGSVQHYFDNINYSSILLSLGLIITFIAYAYQNFVQVINISSIVKIIAISACLFLFLTKVLPPYIPHYFIGNHEHTH